MLENDNFDDIIEIGRAAIKRKSSDLEFNTIADKILLITTQNGVKLVYRD